MKLLLLIVSLIAVFTADCRDIVGGSEPINNTVKNKNVALDRDSFKKYPLLQKGAISLIDGIKDSGTIEGDEQLDTPSLAKAGMKVPYGEEDNAYSKMKLRRSRCKARNACVVLGGICVTNATLCSGRLVAEGCKGTNCQCCVPGTLELKMESYELELQSLKNNLTQNTMELKVDLQGLNKNNTEAIIDLKMEIQSMKSNISQSNSNMAAALEYIIRHLGCNEGFFKTNGSSKCYRTFRDKTRTWSEAKTKCREEGLVLARPLNEAAISLRRDILSRDGSGRNWLDARGDGSTFRWQYDNSEFRTNNPGWRPGFPSSVTTSWCLTLQVYDSDTKNYPNQPYIETECNRQFYTVCQDA